MKSKGLTDQEIAEELEVRRETVNRYLNQEVQEIHEQYSSMAKERLKNKLKEELHSTFEYKRRKLFEMIENEDCPESVRLGALKELSRDVESKCDILVKIGVIESEEKEEDFEDISPQEIESLRRAKRMLHEGVEEVRRQNAEKNSV